MDRDIDGRDQNGVNWECPVLDASDDEHGLRSGQGLQPIEQPNSLTQAVMHLAQSMTRQNELLMQIVAQNADLLEMLTSDGKEEDERPRDMLGHLID